MVAEILKSPKVPDYLISIHAHVQTLYINISQPKDQTDHLHAFKGPTKMTLKLSLKPATKAQVLTEREKSKVYSGAF